MGNLLVQYYFETESFEVRVTAPNGQITYVKIILKDCDGRETDPCKKAHARNNKIKENSELSMKFDSDRSNYTIFPNPVKDVIFLSSNFNQNQNLYIYDMKGSLVKNIKYSDNIDVSDLDEGLYLIKIEGNPSKIFKFIKLNQ